MKIMNDLLRCLLLPLEKMTLILPYAAVAEVVSCDSIQVLPGTPSWVLGSCAWRELSLMILDFEQLGQARVSDTTHPMPKEKTVSNTTGAFKVAVLNRSQENASVDFIGIKLKAIPKMSRYKSSDFKFITGYSDNYLLMDTWVKEQKVAIPNLVWMERKLSTLSKISL